MKIVAIISIIFTCKFRIQKIVKSERYLLCSGIKFIRNGLSTALHLTRNTLDTPKLLSINEEFSPKVNI